MKLKMNGFWSTATLVALTAGLSAQTPGQAPAPPNTATSQERPTFKVQVDLVSNDIIVRDVARANERLGGGPPSVSEN